MKVSMYSKTRNRGLVFVSMGSHEEALAAFTNLQSYVIIDSTPLFITKIGIFSFSVIILEYIYLGIYG